ncbi:hypothetical protein [Nostoc phage YongM]|nr:hypothetical protein [Nostoc phage YongM]
MRKSDVIGWSIIFIMSIYFLAVSWYEAKESDSGGKHPYECVK